MTGTQIMSDLNFKPILFGSGRLARHLSHYLRALRVDFLEHRDSRSFEGLDQSVAQGTHLWMLIPDDAIPELANALKDRFPKIQLIHSCAAKSIPHAVTLHPLMTFSRDLYPLSDYARIPITLFKEELDAFPGTEAFVRKIFPNPIQVLPLRTRTAYHLNCVMISNLSVLLWTAAMKAGPGLAPLVFGPILEQTLKNFLSDGEKALTGPLARRDLKTIELHLKTLEGTPEQGLYLAFKEYFYAHRA